MIQTEQAQKKNRTQSAVHLLPVVGLGDGVVHVVWELVTVNGGLHVAGLVVAKTQLQEHVLPIMSIQLGGVMRDGRNVALRVVVDGDGCGERRSPVPRGRGLFGLGRDICGRRGELESLLVMGR